MFAVIGSLMLTTCVVLICHSPLFIKNLTNMKLMGTHTAYTGIGAHTLSMPINTKKLRHPVCSAQLIT